MEYAREKLEMMVLRSPPPLDSEFLAWEEAQRRNGPPPLPSALEERQPVFAERYRDLTTRMMSRGSRDYYLSEGITKSWLTVDSSVDGFSIPVMQLESSQYADQEPDAVVIFYHGGGLVVGEADTEELSYRRMVKEAGCHIRLYSVGYRLSVPHGAEKSLSDSLDCFQKLATPPGKTIIAGSSSGGQLAAAVSQAAPSRIDGVMLRGPVTADACSGMQYVPERFRPFHTTASPAFTNSMSFLLARVTPRDGLAKLPLEADIEVLASLPKTWIQASTNDTLYSDALCYAMALQEAGVQVRLDVMRSLPHTFWLVAPELAKSLEAEERMINGLKWLLEK